MNKSINRTPDKAEYKSCLSGVFDLDIHIANYIYFVLLFLSFLYALGVEPYLAVKLRVK